MYWSAIKAGWKIVLGAVVVVVAAAVVLSWQTTPQYVASTRLFVTMQTGSDDLDEYYQRSAIAQQRVASYVVLAMSGAAVDEVSEIVGFEVKPEDVEAQTVLGTAIIEIRALDTDRRRALSVASAYQEVLPRLVDEIEQVGDATSERVKLTMVQEAGIPVDPLSPALRNLVAGLLLGLTLGVGLAVLRFAIQREAKADRPGTGAI